VVFVEEAKVDVAKEFCLPQKHRRLGKTLQAKINFNFGKFWVKMIEISAPGIKIAEILFLKINAI